MDSALNNEMFSYFEQLNDSEKKSVIQMLQNFLKSRPGKGYDLNIDEYNHEVNEAEQEYQRGEFVRHEDLLNEIEKWKAGNTK